jgi:glycosyltransferase involved in cell wall biosynthesis
MIRCLGDELDFSVFCSDKDHDRTHLGVESDKWLQYNNAEVFYASQYFLKATNITSLIKVRQPEVLFINGIYSWYFNILPLLKINGIRKIVSVRGMLHPGALSQKVLKKTVFLALWKLFGLHKRCEFHATTPEEKYFIEQVFGNKIKTWVAGNLPNILNYQVPAQKKQNSLILTSIALISPMKNHLLVLQGLTKVTASIEYHIYGPIKDKRYWDQCESVISRMPSNILVMYKGEVVPVKVGDALSSAHIFILPSKSENFGHAIYEALTAGKPVITSHHTPWSKLQENDSGLNVCIENIDEITSAIQFFASMENDIFSKWSKNARTYALNALNFSLIKEQYVNMFESKEM